MWVRREKERELQAAGKKGLPWPLYLVMSALVAIASVRAINGWMQGRGSDGGGGAVWLWGSGGAGCLSLELVRQHLQDCNHH